MKTANWYFKQKNNRWAPLPLYHIWTSWTDRSQTPICIYMKIKWSLSYVTVPRRIRIVSHNASDKVILPRLFQIWRHFEIPPVWGRRVLHVQFFQSNFDIHGKRKQVMPFCTGDRTFAGQTYYDGLFWANVKCLQLQFILIQHSGRMS